MNKEQLIKEFTAFLQPLANAGNSKESLKEFIKEFGFKASSTEIDQMYSDFEAFRLTVINLDKQIENGELELQKVSSEIIRIFGNIQALVTKNTIAHFFGNQFFTELLDYLLDRYLSIYKPDILSLVESMGAIETKIIPAGIRDIDYQKIKFKWKQISEFITNNAQWLKEVYGWSGNPTMPIEKRLDYELILNTLQLILESLGLSLVYVRELFETELSDFLKNIPIGEKFYGATLPLFQMGIDEVDDEGIPTFKNEAGFKFMPFGNLNDPKNLGIALAPYAKGGLSQSHQLTDKLSLTFEISSEASGGAYLTITPSNISHTGGGQANGKFEMALKYANEDESDLELFSIEDLASLKFKSISTEIGGNLNGNFYLSARIRDLEFTLDVTKDKLLSNIVTDPIVLFIGDLGIKWQYGKGLSFEGGNNLGIQMPVHVDFGALGINTFGIEMDLIKNPSLITTISTNLNLGIISGAIKSIGSKIAIVESTHGLLGKYDLKVGLQSPKGIGLSIDAGVVKGGGFMDYYPEKGEYSGSLELTFSDFLSLKAIGIINTKMPDGKPGFSLIVIITAEFGSGVQLGFGFTLLGVGGLLGLNRMTNLDALSQGVQTGALNSIMFPTNVIENAPRIISDLKTFFPIKQGEFLIGPMAKLGWGTPRLISITLGIIIDISGKISILGILKIALPTEEKALIVLQVSFIGSIDLNKNRMWFFASMYDSRVLFITLEGEMGLLVDWGKNPNFVASVGGFHPAFNPPALPFPNPERISLNLLNKSNAKIRVMAYFAVTSNTAQFGARAELFFGFSSLKVEGHIAFDALFQFSPFYMIIQLSASLSVRVFGVGMFSVRVKMTLEGPSPWKVHGTGSISLLFFDVKVGIDFTWGENKNTTLPPIFVMPLLVAELEKLENWKALIPAHNKLFVSLRKIDTVAELVLHPLGSLQVSQRAIPLEFNLDKVGTQKPADAKKFEVNPSNSEFSRVNEIKEKFAIAQFQDLKDAEKLSKPSYQNIDGGIELSVKGDQLTIGKSAKRHVRYELILIDSNYKRVVKAFYELIKRLFGNLLKGNTVARSTISHQNLIKRQPFAEKIITQEQGFAVASNINNQMFEPNVQFSSQAQAIDYMKVKIDNNPQLTETLHVLPLTEINHAV